VRSADELTLLGLQKETHLFFVKLIGYLLVRKMVGPGVIGEVLHHLVGRREAPIVEDHHIECACELLKIIGPSFDSVHTHANCKLVFDNISLRLLELKEETDPETESVVFSMKSRFQIGYIIDLRGRNWQKQA
jgi:hypothetical protein